MPKRVIIKTTAQARAYLADGGVLGRLTIEDDRVITSAACGRCGGSGNGGWHQDGGICYECGGRDTSKRTRSATLVNYARAERRREMAHARKVKAAAKRFEASTKRQRDWCEANGFGRITFDEKNVIVADRREAERAEAAKTSHHIGTVGKRDVFELELVFTTGWENAYGYVNLFSFRDVGTGQTVTWTTSSYPSIDQTLVWDEGSADEWTQETSRQIVKGDILAIKGTVKEHGEYKDVAQTKLTRCKIEHVVAESSGAKPDGWVPEPARPRLSP